MVPSDWNMPDSSDGFRSLWPGQIQGVGMAGYASSHQPISKMFLVYSILMSNFFDSNKPNALNTHNRNVRTKYIALGEALRIRVKKFKQNLPEHYSKSTKIAIVARKFSKIFGGACPRNPLQQFQICSSEKNTLETMWKLCLSPLLKFLATPLPADAWIFFLHFTD